MFFFVYLFLDLMNVHLIDIVSGGIVTTITHRRVKGPVNIVHSENWLVYTYYNDKLRRNELSMFIENWHSYSVNYKIKLFILFYFF